MASRSESPKICCLHSTTAPVQQQQQAGFDVSDGTSTGSASACSESTTSALGTGSAMAGGGLQPQPASGEVLDMMGEDISHIDPNEHHRNLKLPTYGSLDPAATIAGSALKGCCSFLINHLTLPMLVVVAEIPCLERICSCYKISARKHRSLHGRSKFASGDSRKWFVDLISRESSLTRSCPLRNHSGVGALLFSILTQDSERM